MVWCDTGMIPNAACIFDRGALDIGYLDQEESYKILSKRFYYEFKWYE